MSKKEKLLKRFLSEPTDFTFAELVTVLKSFDFKLDNGGNTTGSACLFIREDGIRYRIHRPHPKNILKGYQISKAIKILKEGGLI